MIKSVLIQLYSIIIEAIVTVKVRNRYPSKNNMCGFSA